MQYCEGNKKSRDITEKPNRIGDNNPPEIIVTIPEKTGNDFIKHSRKPVEPIRP